MTQICIVNRSGLGKPDCAFIANACNQQMTEAAQAWGVEPTPVVFYDTADGLPPIECRIMVIVDSLDEPGALGYHTDELGDIFARVLNQGPVDTCTTVSHECLEMLVDPECTAWRPAGMSGREVALEVCDPVQADSYPIGATIAGETRQMMVSNYVLPRWFDPAGVGAFDAMLKLDAPLSMSAGGYEIVRDSDGNRFDIFARTRLGDNDAKVNVAMKIARKGSRTLRRLRGGK